MEHSVECSVAWAKAFESVGIAFAWAAMAWALCWGLTR